MGLQLLDCSVPVGASGRRPEAPFYRVLRRFSPCNRCGSGSLALWQCQASSQLRWLDAQGPWISFFLTTGTSVAIFMYGSKFRLARLELKWLWMLRRSLPEMVQRVSKTEPILSGPKPGWAARSPNQTNAMRNPANPANGQVNSQKRVKLQVNPSFFYLCLFAWIWQYLTNRVRFY